MTATDKIPGIGATFEDAWLIDGMRTPFVDYNGALAPISPIDLGIKAAREAIRKSGVPAKDVGTVIAGSMAQASFAAYMLPRHVGLFAGVPHGGISSAFAAGSGPVLLPFIAFAFMKCFMPLPRIVASGFLPFFSA